jgi:hypothetical protein
LGSPKTNENQPPNGALLLTKFIPSNLKKRHGH